jgi:hypothetical protein
VVSGSAHDSVRLFGSAAVCSSVRQCSAVCGSKCARLSVCDSTHGGVRQSVGLCVAVFGSKCGGVRAVRAAVCDSAIGSVR